MSAPDHTTLWRRVFVALLCICMAQVSYWVVDQITHASRLRDQDLARISSISTLEDSLAADATQLRAAIERHLSDDAAHARISPTEADPVLAIHDEYESLRTRLFWEGSFFLLVLFGAMGVITRTLRESHLLIMRQQNFIASVSHELRTPLASLKLSADTLALRPPDAAHAATLAARMTEDVDRLNSMVSQVLQSARLDAKTPTEAPTPTHLAPLLEAELARMRTIHEARGVQFRCDLPEDLHLLARGPELKIVLTNLLTNAAKSCRASGAGTVTVQARLTGRQAEITVSDDGIGFPPGEAERIFERFYRTGDELRRETSGYGLGLYLVAELTRSHSGRVYATSPGPGQGATFTLWWPAAPSPTPA